MELKSIGIQPIGWPDIPLPDWDKYSYSFYLIMEEAAVQVAELITDEVLAIVYQEGELKCKNPRHAMGLRRL